MHLLPEALSPDRTPTSFYDDFNRECVGDRWIAFVKEKVSLILVF